MKKVEDKSEGNTPLPQHDGKASRSSGRPDKIPRIGRALRKNRKKSGLSLRTLAELSGVSVGMISSIERDISNPSLKTLTKLRHALDMPLNAFFESHPDVPTFVRRKNDRGQMDLGNLGIYKELLTAGDHKYMQLTIMNVEPQGSSGDQMLRYASEKAGLLLSGKLILTVGDQEALLEAGDSFQFNGQKPHGFKNPGDEVARFLWIIARTAEDQLID